MAKRLRRMPARATDAMWRQARAGNGIWLAAAIMASGLRLLVRWSKREREVVYRGELAPGEQLMIRHVPPDDEGGSSAAEGA
ncbi:hypothetical protein [Candidatus Poriferisodalis sp.]|uniref:hypothetical protein n=1 Tax=Candidatus Poriferisodalis sp. TaxID=3101277 RepID=UPI003B01141F